MIIRLHHFSLFLHNRVLEVNSVLGAPPLAIVVDGELQVVLGGPLSQRRDLRAGDPVEALEVADRLESAAVRQEGPDAGHGGLAAVRHAQVPQGPLRFSGITILGGDIQWETLWDSTPEMESN